MIGRAGLSQRDDSSSVAKTSSPMGVASVQRELEQLGYNEVVAHRIATDLPALARRILSTPIDPSGARRIRAKKPIDLLNWGAFDGRPVTLYRGVAVERSKIDTRFKEAPRGIPGLTFYSTELAVPIGYASGDALKERDKALARGETAGSIIELQVPGFLVLFYGHPVLRAIDVPDFAPFIVRTARVDYRRPPPQWAKPEQLSWSK
ncbi:MAG: hypothetical protein IT384_29115 [Deltaproteobacteria bacterium]|nr:hypothetical protein [Deltaproteobacteria bacterium]